MLFLMAGFEVIFSYQDSSGRAMETTFLYRDENNYKMEWQGGGIVKSNGKLYFYSIQEDGSRSFVPVKSAAPWLKPMMQEQTAGIRYYGKEGYYRVKYLGKKKKIAGLPSKLYRIKFYNANGTLIGTEMMWLSLNKNYISASLKMLKALMEIQKETYGAASIDTYSYKKYREFMYRYGAPTSYEDGTLVKFAVKNIPSSEFKVEASQSNYPQQETSPSSPESMDIESLPLPEDVKKALKQRLLQGQ